MFTDLRRKYILQTSGILIKAAVSAAIALFAIMSIMAMLAPDW